MVAAEEFTVDGIKYNVTDSVARTVEVVANDYKYNITIPETVMPDTIAWTVTAIGKDAFRNNSNVTHVTLPNTVTKIKGSAFEGSSLISITLSNALDTIENSAFEDCRNLTAIEIPSSLTTIGNRAFSHSSLASIEIPNKVTIIPNEAFYYCRSLKSVKLPESIVEIGESAFSECSNMEHIEMPNVYNIKSSAFMSCSRLKHINLPKTLTEIGASAFHSCSELTEINLPDNITEIESQTFANCPKLKKINLPKNLISITGEKTFSDCSALSGIAIPPHMNEISSNGCFSHSTLKRIFIPSSIRVLGARTFSYCTKLEEMHVRHSNPLKIDSNVFSSGYISDNTTDISKCTLYVPKGCSEAYMAADVWKDFGAIVEEGLSINLESSKTMIAGTSAEILKTTTPNVFPASGIEWSSSNVNVASVDEYGVVTTISEGTAVITAKMTLIEGFDQEEAFSSCTLTVKSSPTDFFTAENATSFTNSTINVPISLTNEKNITAFQCDIYLPNGLALATVEDEYDFTFAGRETRTHTISSELQSDGAVRVAAFSSKNSPFSGNSGELFNIPLVISETTGDFKVEIKNIILVDEKNAEQATVDVSFWVSVRDFITGDANSDHKVSISDATTTVSYILGENPEPFMIQAADVTADGSITITDVTGIVDILLGSASAAPSMKVASASETAETDYLYIEDFNFEAGESKDIEICLANEKPFTAFQCDIYLSNGLNFLVEDEEYIVDLSNRKSRTHTIATSLQEDGSLRVVVFSSKNTAFTGNDGALMILPLIADNTLTENAEISIKNNLFAADNVEYKLPDLTVSNKDTSAIKSITGNGNVRVWAEGNVLHIVSPEECSMRLYSLDGTGKQLDVKSGHNTFNVDRKGLYIVNQQKVLIK